MTASKLFIISIVLTAFFIYNVTSSYYPLRKDTIHKRERTIDPKKRPFCNAFTGCGRKRSNLPALSDHGEILDDSIASLMELSAEPAVEDLSRQIMSEAKLWEAIQEANMELNRRRHPVAERPQEGVGIPTPNVAGTCLSPPCYI